MVAELFRRGGPLMWLLVPLSILALTISIERLLYWTGMLLSTIRNCRVAERARSAALDERDRDRIPRIRDPLPYLLHRLHGAGLRSDAVEAGLETEMARAGAGSGLLFLLAEISTSVGLFGTVWGVTKLLPAYRGGDIGGVVAGLSTALYTTVAGLALFLLFYPIAELLSFLAERQRRRLTTEIEAVAAAGSTR